MALGSLLAGTKGPHGVKLDLWWAGCDGVARNTYHLGWGAWLLPLLAQVWKGSVGCFGARAHTESGPDWRAATHCH